MSDEVETLEFEVELEGGDTATLTLGAGLAREWRDIIDDRLANGPGGVVKVPMRQPDGEPIQFRLPPLVAEEVRNEIEEALSPVG